MTDEAPPAPPLPIHQALAVVSRAVVAVGKDARNEQAGYAARSIDGVLDMIHGPLADAGVVLIPTITDHVITERPTRSGGVQYHVTLWAEFTFYGPAGDHLTIRYPGEATDSGDKATTKALSQALKAALIQTFTIPVNGDDPDTHEPEPSVPMADRPAIEALAERLGVLWARIGRTAYPNAWKALRIPPVPYMREHGVSVTLVGQANAILDDVMAGLTAPDAPVEASDEPATPAQPGTCPECTMDGTGTSGHTEGCPNEPF